MRLFLFVIPIALVAIVAFFAYQNANRPAPATVGSGDPVARLKNLTTEVSKSIDALKVGDVDKARKEFDEFDEGWETVEDAVKAKSAAAYRQIQDAMDEVKARLLRAEKSETSLAQEALDRLNKTIDDALPNLR